MKSLQAVLLVIIEIVGLLLIACGEGAVGDTEELLPLPPLPLLVLPLSPSHPPPHPSPAPFPNVYFHILPASTTWCGTSAVSIPAAIAEQYSAASCGITNKTWNLLIGTSRRQLRLAYWVNYSKHFFRLKIASVHISKPIDFFMVLKKSEWTSRFG